MTAIDSCEAQIIRAFEKEAWRIKQKPLYLRLPDRILWIDLALERQTDQGAETIIVVEVKCFPQPKDDLNEFYRMIGQYQTYRNALKLLQDPSPLYVALPAQSYQRLAAYPEFAMTMNDAKLKCVVIDLDTEEITKWIP